MAAVARAALRPVSHVPQLVASRVVGAVATAAHAGIATFDAAVAFSTSRSETKAIVINSNELDTNAFWLQLVRL